MHGQQAFRHFVKRVSAEVLTVALLAFQDYVCHATLIHVLKKDVNRLVPIEKVNTVDQFIALKVRNQTGLIDGHSLLSML